MIIFIDFAKIWRDQEYRNRMTRRDIEKAPENLAMKTSRIT